MKEFPRFNSDYMEGAHPRILARIAAENLKKHPGYGEDDICAAAKQKIRTACACPDARVEFLVGGTQTNSTVLDALLRSWQGVVAVSTGHINCYECGTIEARGHKIIPLPGQNGKLTPAVLSDYLAGFWADEDHEHMMEPGAVYISHPTEIGTLYTKSELTALSGICRQYRIPLYVDGARLGYGLTADGTDVTLEDLAKLADAFYIGGTKVGALIGEAVVFPNPDIVDHFVTIKKQHGGLLAKGWLLGVQFDELFTDDLYFKISRSAVEKAMRLRDIFKAKGYKIAHDSPTNQQFILLDNDTKRRLAEKVDFAFWENADADHTVVRFCTSWATTDEQIRQLETLL
jgi:threonine aldolase